MKSLKLISKLLLVLSLFFITSCDFQQQKMVIEEKPKDNNTAIMVEVQDTLYNNVAALKVCFTDSICGIFALDNGLANEHFIFDSVFFNKIIAHYPFKLRDHWLNKHGPKDMKVYDGELSVYVCDCVINVQKVAAISAFSKRGGGLDGVIGSKFFEENIVEINYDNRTVSILESIDNKESGYTPIPLLRTKDFPNLREFEVIFPKVGTIKCLFDLGHPGSLGVNFSIWKSLGLDTNNCIKTVVYQSLGNPSTMGYVSQIDSICINNLMVKNPLIAIEIFGKEKGDFLAFSLPSPAIIGRGILSQYNMIIDYPKDTLYLKKRTK